jgi:hypothetical protein
MWAKRSSAKQSILGMAETVFIKSFGETTGSTRFDFVSLIR